MTSQNKTLKVQGWSGSDAVVSANEMRMLERHAIDGLGIPAKLLMENAGREAAAFLRELSGKMESWPFQDCSSKPWLFLIGKGNNGGDGLVAARHLVAWGGKAELLYVVDPDELRGDAALNRDIARKMGIPEYIDTESTSSRGKSANSTELYQRTNIENDILEPAKQDLVKKMDPARFEGIVDALLGTGASGAPRGNVAKWIRWANESGLPIVALDLPSGVCADTGRTFEPHIRAVCTVTFGFAKRGLLQYPGAGAAGKVVVRPIGMPDETEQCGVRVFALSEQTLIERLGIDPSLPRHADTHKGTFGHVLAAAGSRAYSGAGWLCCKAALRAGAGLVSWAVPATIAERIVGSLPEAILLGMSDSGSGDWQAEHAEALCEAAIGKNALIVGPGIGRFTGDDIWLRRIWENCPLPLVVDADALNIIANAGGLSGWPQRKEATILTPHPGEMARLSGLSLAEVQADRIGTAQRLAVAHNVILVLKGARTVIAQPDGTVYINLTGNAGMATGGSGDVLAGMIGALLAQGYSAVQAAAFGVYWHGTAGDRAAARRNTDASLIASDIIDAL